MALAKSELAEADAAVGSKRQEMRVEVRQKARDVRELEAGREVARLDLKLAQETLAITQTRFDQGQSSLRELEKDRLTESEKWVEFLMRILRGNRDSFRFCRRPGSWRRCSNSV